MAPIPAPYNHTILAIAAALESAEEPWESIGISAGLIGAECDRALFYEHRRVSPQETITWRKRRIFERGNIEEDRLLDLLAAIGCEVSHQQEKVRDCGGHVRGKIDAQATGIPDAPVKEHVVECKSSNAKGFKLVVAADPLKGGEGIKKSKPLHYATIQFYMHKRGVDRCLYMVSNKDDEDLYTERVDYDAEYAIRLVTRAERIIRTEDPPAKLHEDPKSKMAFACKFCKHLAVCHEDSWPRVNCRTCLFSTAELGGDALWTCARWNKPLNLEEQAAGCPAHLFLPGLVPGKQVDSSEEEGWVSYKLNDGREWRDGSKESGKTH